MPPHRCTIRQLRGGSRSVGVQHRAVNYAVPSGVEQQRQHHRKHHCPRESVKLALLSGVSTACVTQASLASHVTLLGRRAQGDPFWFWLW